MAQDLVIVRNPGFPATPGRDAVPALFAQAGESGSRRFLEFFAATIRNRNTRQAYAAAAARFAAWCESQDLKLKSLSPIDIASYVELLGLELAKPSVKQHLAALRVLFDWLVTGQVIPARTIVWHVRTPGCPFTVITHSKQTPMPQYSPRGSPRRGVVRNARRPAASNATATLSPSKARTSCPSTMISTSGPRVIPL